MRKTQKRIKDSVNLLWWSFSAKIVTKSCYLFSKNSTIIEVL